MSEVDAYDYPLPKHLIAQEPLARRTDARLMLVERSTGAISHYHIRDLPELLAAPDALVLNETRVLPARLVGHRISTGGRWEGLFLSADGEGNWRLLAKARGKLAPGENIRLVSSLGTDALQLPLLAREPDGVWICRPVLAAGASIRRPPISSLLELAGRVPLPHYIRGGEMVASDSRRYQTVFARQPAPWPRHRRTPLQCRAARPTRSHRRPPGQADAARRARYVPPNHRRAARRSPNARRVGRARCGGGRYAAGLPPARAGSWAVGTTCVRVLETAAAGGTLAPWRGETRLFIRPPYQFRAVERAAHQFSSPPHDVVGVGPRVRRRRVDPPRYEEAVAEEYRFYSYGDAMLIV